MGRADLHVHTRASDGAGSVDQVLAAASRKGLDVIAITDHNEIEAAFEAAEKAAHYGVEVIVGEEISSTAGHILGLFLKKKIPYGISPRELVTAIHGQGGLAVIPHPFVPKPFPKYQGIGREWVGALMLVHADLLTPDAIEVANGLTKRIPNSEELIREANYTEWHLPEVGGSDSHHPRSVGSCWTDFLGETAEDLRVAIINGDTRAAGSGWAGVEVMRSLSKDLFYYRLKKRFVGPEPWQYSRPKNRNPR